MRYEKRIWSVLLLVLMMVLMLSGCGCEHQWVEASCTEAKMCTLCGEAEGIPLGHDWKEASCENARTCNRCSMTNGEPLGHDLTEATLTKAATCMTCGTTPAGALSLADEKIVGKWESFAIHSAGEFSLVPSETGYCEFKADGTGKIGSDTKEYDIKWSFFTETDSLYLYSLGTVSAGITVDESDSLYDKLIILTDADSGDGLVFERVK